VTPVPAATLRHFFGHEAQVAELSRRAAEDAAGDPSWGHVVGRLLEDGDGADLRWLFAARGEAAVRDWLELHGRRALSRRSRIYWHRLLAVDGVDSRDTAPATARALWPLA
jgi:hypothetical protein